MKVFVVVSYNDGVQHVFKTREAAVTDCQKITESWGSPMDEWNFYFYVDEVDYFET